jgi:hypothetical protein
MTATSGRTCLLLALLSVALIAALPIGLDARHHGVIVQAQIAQLQGSPPMDEGAVAPASDVSDKTTPCAQRETYCQPSKQELAFAVSDHRLSNESKALSGDDIQPESRD